MFFLCQAVTEHYLDFQAVLAGLDSCERLELRKRYPGRPHSCAPNLQHIFWGVGDTVRSIPPTDTALPS